MTGVSAYTAATMMAQAGLMIDKINAGLAKLKPIARFDGVAYFNPTHVSRYIKRSAA